MSFPCLDTKVLSKVFKNLDDHEYVSFNLTGTEKKILNIVYVIIERNDSVFRLNYFPFKEEHNNYIYCQLEGYQNIELNALLEKECAPNSTPPTLLRLPRNAVGRELI